MICVFCVPQKPFGSTQEVALLKMEKDGIKEVQHPERRFKSKGKKFAWLGDNGSNRGDKEHF